MRPVYRQGDVLLRKRTKEELFSWDIKALSEGENKVAERLEISGETGKAHVLEAPVYRHGSQLLVVLEKPTAIEHPDHAPITLPPGVYEVARTRSEVRLFRSVSARD
jgi:hypothetical protein